MGKLEGSNGPRRVVQSLWSGAAAAVHRLACPRPVSGPVESNDCVPVAGVVGLHAVIITMRRSPAGGQPKPPARRSVDMVLRDQHADKGSTIATSLLSQEARLTFWTLVDDVGAWDTAREWRQGGRRVPLAPGCLTTRVIAKATPTVRNKADSTPLAHAGNRLAAIVTQRGARHSRSPCAGAGPACV